MDPLSVNGANLTGVAQASATVITEVDGVDGRNEIFEVTIRATNPQTALETTGGKIRFFWGEPGPYEYPFSEQPRTSPAVAWNASPSAIQSAIEAIPNVASAGGSVLVTETSSVPGERRLQVEFAGGLAYRNVSDLTAASDPDDVLQDIHSEPGLVSAQTVTHGARGTLDEVQVVTLRDVQGGAFTLTFQSAVTGPIPHNADAATVQAALRSLASVGDGNIAVTGTAGGPWQITFQGELGGRNVTSLGLDAGNLSGGQILIGTVRDGGSIIEAVADAVEGGENGYFRFHRSGRSDGDVTVYYRVEAASSAAAGIDYRSLPGSVVLRAGQTSVDVPLVAFEDGLFEGDETVQVTLLADPQQQPRYGLGTPSAATATIVDADALPVNPTVTLSATVDASENGQVGYFRISRTGDGQASITVTYQVDPYSSATSSADYQPLAGSMVLGSGQFSADVLVTAVDDAVSEGSEFVRITLVGVDHPGYQIGQPSSGTVTIVDNDAPSNVPTVSIIATQNAVEGGANGFVRLQRTGSAASPLTVTYRVVEAYSSAVNGTDVAYLAGTSQQNPLEGSVTFGSGQQTVDIAVNAVDDALVEETETLQLALTSSSGGQYVLAAPDRATVRVLDNDSPGPAPYVSQIGLVQDTGHSSSDRITFDPRLQVTVLGAFQGGYAEVEFDHNGNYSPEGHVTISGSGGSAVYDPRAFDSSLAGTTGLLVLRYRVVHYASDSSLVGQGPWNVFAITLDDDPSVGDVRVRNLRLARDTGQPNDKVTVDPTVVAEVLGDFAGGSVRLEFDHDGDDTPEGQVLIAQPGSAVRYDPRQSDASVATRVGPFVLRYRVVELNSGGGVVEIGPWTALGMTLQPPPTSDYTIDNLSLNSSAAVDQPGLVEQLGGETAVYDSPVIVGEVARGWEYESNSGYEESYDGTWAEYGYLDGSDYLNGLLAEEDPFYAPQGDEFRAIAYVVVEFDHDGDGVVDGKTVTDTSNRFTYRPAGLSYGTHTIRARALEWNYQYGQYLPGPWTTFTFTWSAKPAPAITSLALAEDTGTCSTDRVTWNPTVIGRLDPATPYPGNVRIEFDHNGDGQIDGVTHTGPDGRFTYVPAGLSTGWQSLRARSARRDAILQEYVYGKWTTLTFTYEGLPVPLVSELGLLIDTGESADDQVTSISTLVGRLSGSGSLSGLLVEFDHDSDGIADGSVSSQYDGRFLYYPVGLPSGAITVRARAGVWDEFAAGYLYGVWTAFSFTLETTANDPVAVENLRLAEHSGEAGGYPVTGNPTLLGALTNDGSVAYLTVEFDHNADGAADGSTQADRYGQFRYLPAGLAVGEVTVRARGVEWDYAGQTALVGPWTSLTFILQQSQNQPPVVAELRLLSDSGVSSSDGYTANATLTGLVTDDRNVGGLAVEFDHNGDGVVDGVAVTDASGRFRYEPKALSHGNLSIRARALEWDYQQHARLTGAWTTLAFTYEVQANSPAVLDEVDLADAPDPASGAPLVTGRITNEGALAGIIIEFDFDADGSADRSTRTDADGAFQFAATGLPYGQVTVYLRTRETDEVSKQYLVSSWQAFSFDNPQPVAAVSQVTALALLNDTGANDQDRITYDPTVTGSVGDESPSTFLVVQFDHNGDAVPDGQVVVASDRQFTYRPQGLALGEVTVRARTKDHDSRGAVHYGDWQSLTFTLEAPPETGLRISSLGLLHDTGLSTTDGSTSNASLSGQIAGGSGLGGLTIEFDHDGDGIAEGTVTPSSGGAFSYSPAGLAHGWQTIYVRAVSSGTSGWVTSPWVSLGFVLSSDPDGTEAQALLTAMTAFGSGWGTAAAVYQSALSAAAATHRADSSEAESATVCCR